VSDRGIQGGVRGKSEGASTQKKERRDGGAPVTPERSATLPMVCDVALIVPVSPEHVGNMPRERASERHAVARERHGYVIVAGGVEADTAANHAVPPLDLQAWRQVHRSEHAPCLAVVGIIVVVVHGAEQRRVGGRNLHFQPYPVAFAVELI